MRAILATDAPMRSGRVVPIPAALRDALVEHRAASTGDGLMFSSSTGRAFDPSTVQARADKAWNEAGMLRVTMHECRHSYASLMAAAGVPIADLSDFMGHASLNITAKRYRHLYPDARRSAATAMDALLHRADTASRLAALDDE